MKNNIIITGGELYNKGAQSMTFNAINRLKLMYPTADIYLMSPDYYREDSEKEVYNFDFLPPTTKSIFKLIYSGAPTLNPKIKEEVSLLKAVLNKAFLNIDLSGLKLSSQMGWQSSLAFLLERQLMEKFSIKQVVFPQSFGPFNYKFPYSLIIDSYAKRILKKPSIIYCRENEAYENISQYTTQNIKKSFDSVFYSRPYNLDNIFKGDKEFAKFDVASNAVGVIPNKMLLKYDNSDEVVEKYQLIIEELLNFGNKVYLFRHSVEDLSLCIDLKESFKDNPDVILLDGDYNCIELQDLISKFKYIVGSRYHSIVHAYEKETPALILGWAYKYKELAINFGQEELIFDIRNDFNFNAIQNGIKILENNRSNLTENIKETLLKIKESDIFEESLGSAVDNTRI